jgi:sporulation inhibitor KapD
MGFFSEIIEIGAVKIDGGTLETAGRIEHFVKPGYSIQHSKEILQFCMISEKDMASAIEFEVMLDEINALYTPGQVYFAAWGDADYTVLDEGCRRRNRDNPVRAEDYLDMSAWYMWEMGDTNRTSLRNALEEQCIDAGAVAHAAVHDAVNTGKLLVQLISDGWNPEEYFSPSE